MPEDLVGRRLGPYEIMSYIGRGGMAEVYQGFHPQLERAVAIKIVGRELQPDPVFETRFRREAKAIARLRHPNIVQVYDYGVAEGGHYMVMEFIDGSTVHDWIGQIHQGERSVTVDDITFVFRQIGAALDHAHKNGVVHRDVKPSNVMIARTGQAILTDFGLALLHSRASEDTSLGTAFGTPEYMAPEQISDSRAAGPASDLYSLGVILFQLLTGELPFESDNPVDTALRHLNDTAPDPRLLNEELPIAVAAVVKKALSKSPKDRFRSGSELSAALEYAYKNPDDVDFLRTQPSSPEATMPLPPMTQDVNQASVRRPTSERIPVNRGPSRIEERREKRRLKAEHSRIQREEKLRQNRIIQLERREKRQRFIATWGRAFLVLAVVLAFIGAAFAGLQSLGIIDVEVKLPEIDVPFPGVVAEAVPGVGAEPSEAAATPSPTLTPTATSTLTPTITPSPTPLQAGEGTPIPPLTFVPLEVGTRVFRVYDGATMLYVPPGIFLMGTNDRFRNPADQPQHSVSLSPYWIDETEVTNRQYRFCVEAGFCQEPVNTLYYANEDFPDYPVTFVAYDNAVAYCLWLAGEARTVIGLPTEAQWEKAAAWNPVEENAQLYPWGNEPASTDLLRFDGSNLNTPMAPAGSYPAGISPYGALDMAGNVWEWVADWYDADYYKRTGIVIDPGGPLNGEFRVTRGGSWTRAANLAVSSVRNPVRPSAFSNEIGFRCAMTIERPTPDSGFYLTPLDMVQSFDEILDRERSEAFNDPATIDEWIRIYLDMVTSLELGDNAAALDRARAALPLLESHRNAGLMSPALSSRIGNSLNWLLKSLEGDV